MVRFLFLLHQHIHTLSRSSWLVPFDFWLFFFKNHKILMTKLTFYTEIIFQLVVTNPKVPSRTEIWSASRPGRYALRRTLTRRINPSRLSQTLIWQHCFFVLLPTVLIAPGSFPTKRSIFHRLLELRTKLALSRSGQPRTLQVVFWNGDGWGDDVREETVASEYNEPPFPLLVLVNVTKCIIIFAYLLYKL